MRYQIKAVPNSKEASIEQEGNVLKVKIDAPPIGGRANQRLIEILADYFNIQQSRVKIISGHISRNKIVEVF